MNRRDILKTIFVAPLTTLFKRGSKNSDASNIALISWEIKKWSGDPNTSKFDIYLTSVFETNESSITKLYFSENKISNNDYYNLIRPIIKKDIDNILNQDLAVSSSNLPTINIENIRFKLYSIHIQKIKGGKGKTNE